VKSPGKEGILPLDSFELQTETLTLDGISNLLAWTYQHTKLHRTAL
jgi:hypothetical protein